MSNESSESLKTGFKGYVDRMTKIRSLSSPRLNEMTTADTYSSVLRENFRHIGELADMNRKLIAEVIDPLIESKEPIPEEVVIAVQTLNEELLDAFEAETIDLPMVQLLSDRLSEDAEAKDDRDYIIRMLDKEVENCYLLLYMTKRVSALEDIAESFREKGLKAVDKLLKYLDKDKYLELSMESREIIMVNSRYCAVLYENVSNVSKGLAEKKLAMLERALEIANDPFYRDALPDYDWKYHFLRIYEYISQTELYDLSDEGKKKAAHYADEYVRLWESDKEYYGKLCEYCEIEGRRDAAYYQAGLISKKEYQDRMLAFFSKRNPYDYNTAGIDCNLEYPLNYIKSLDRADLSEAEKERVDEIYKSIIAYMFFIPKMGMLSLTLAPYARGISDFMEVPGNINFEEMCIRCIAALHPPTYIHSMMVAQISRCLAAHLFDMQLELFKDYPGAETCDTDSKKKYVILENIYHAALCHDVGKLVIIDTIFVYGRKLMDFEFDMIKRHPDIGAQLLSMHDSTREYVDIARGHHIWYDGSGGYPREFDIQKSPYKTAIDIVACADCMDAATDSVGRSYNKGKTLDEYIKEVEEGAGKRYAPWAPALLNNEEVKRDLEFLLSEGRVNVYRETYLLLRSVNDSAK